MHSSKTFHRRLRLLIMEERPLLQEGLAKIFADDPAFVASVVKREEIVDRATEFWPTIVLLSVSPPSEMYFSTARMIRERLVDVKIVFLEDRLHPEHFFTAFRTCPIPLGSLITAEKDCMKGCGPKKVLKADCIGQERTSWGETFSGNDRRWMPEQKQLAWGYWTWQNGFASLRQGLFDVAEGKISLCPEAQRSLQSAECSFLFNAEETSSTFKKLSRREAEVCRHLVAGLSVRQCAEQLGLAPSTVDNHKCRLMKKLRVHKAVDLVRLVLQASGREEVVPSWFHARH